MTAQRVAKAGYVEHISDSVVYVVCRDRRFRRIVRQLGGRWSILDVLLEPSAGLWRRRISYSGGTNLATLLGNLRDAGFAFAGAPHGWPPAAVFSELRETGALAGTFVEISSAGPDQPVVREQ
jgi:hypothetical protein